jgi:hypothetical protein
MTGDGYPIGNQQLGYVEPLERGADLGRRDLGEREVSRREIEPRDAGAVLARLQRDEQAVALRVEQIGIGDRTGRDDAQHLAFDRSLACRRVADLLADRHRFAELHELREVARHRVIRDARHRYRRARRLSARGERDVEEPRARCASS